MRKEVSIVRSAEIKNYRRVAQLHWGLTDEQMLGMHVHHHPPVSEGGRNIPEHLYVCSPSMHSNGWHNGEYFIEQASRGGSKGAKAGNAALPREARVRGGLTQGYRSFEEGTGLFAPGSVTTETCASGGRVGGKCPWWTDGEVDVRAWECPGGGWRRGRSQNDWGKRPYWTNGKENKRSWDCPGEGWRQGLTEVWWTDGVSNLKVAECPGVGWRRGRSGMNKQRFKCLVTGFETSSAALSRYQNARNIDTSLRVKVG